MNLIMQPALIFTIDSLSGHNLMHHQQPQQQNAKLKRVCTNVSSSENHANAF